MHPILKDRARLGTYLLGWVPVALLLLLTGPTLGWTWLGSAAVALPLAAVGSGLFLTSWYLCLAFPLERMQDRGRWPAWIVAALLLGNLWAGCAWLIAWVLGHFPNLKVDPTAWTTPWAFFATVGTLLYLGNLALHYVLTALEQRRTSERTEQELRVLAREAELKALRAQLNPHFLFNSLNSVSALTTVDPGRAREMCVLLSDFLRKSLRLGERASVPLAEELDLARNYLAIEQIRFGARLQVVWEVDESLHGVEVPTLLLQPLVENAIKHGIAQVTEGGILRITVVPHGPYAEVTVENPVDEDAEPPVGLGLGLRQVKQRLQARFAHDTYFQTRIQEGHHTVVLGIPRDPSEVQP